MRQAKELNNKSIINGLKVTDVGVLPNGDIFVDFANGGHATFPPDVMLKTTRSAWRNLADKQAGFYVKWTDGETSSAVDGDDGIFSNRKAAQAYGKSSESETPWTVERDHR